MTRIKARVEGVCWALLCVTRAIVRKCRLAKGYCTTLPESFCRANSGKIPNPSPDSTIAMIEASSILYWIELTETL